MMSALALLLAAASTPQYGELYRPDDGRRPEGRVAVVAEERLVQMLGERGSPAETRMMALEQLAWREAEVPHETLRDVRRLARGGFRIDYARCLGRSPGEDALEELEDLRDHRTPEVRAECVYALALRREDGEDFARRVLRAVDDASPPERVAALRALADRGSVFAHVEALRRLRTAEGPLLFEAMDVIRREPVPDDILALIDLLAEHEGRAANEAVDVLQDLTNYRIRADHRTWKHHYLKHKAEGTRFWRESSEEGDQRTLAYLGVPLYGDRIVFLLDSSTSMNEALYRQPRQTRATKSVREFVSLLPQLPPGASFNVVFFDSRVRSFSRDLVERDEEALAEARAWVQENAFEGGTNLFAGLESAFAHTGAEELVLLSDGSPTVGVVVDPAQILARVDRWNRWRKLRISTIGFGAPPAQQAFLYMLATGNGGVCRIIE